MKQRDTNTSEQLDLDSAIVAIGGHMRPNQRRAAVERVTAEWEAARILHKRTDISTILITPHEVWRGGKEVTQGKSPGGDAGSNMKRIAAK